MKIPISIPAETFRIRAIDLVVFLLIAGVLSLIVYIASQWSGDYDRTIEIDLNPAKIPEYSAQSLARIFFAYILSFIFSIWYGYTASRSKIHEKIMIPILDILQSIPVLSFLPGVVLAMIALFPGKRIGIEIACIILIFTGQVWNMTYSFYHSVNTIPKEMHEVVRLYKFNKFSKFLKLDLPFSAIGLIWNSIMSVAGGWFFLMACEMFILEGKDFRLPGLGSYIQTAANVGSIEHIFYGLGTMVFLITVIDIFIWRPLVVWSQKFRMDTVQREDERESIVLNILTTSIFFKKITKLFNNIISSIEKLSYRKLIKVENKIVKSISRFLGVLISISFVLILVWLLIKAFNIASGVTWYDIWTIISSAFFSLLRTSAAVLIALAWTLPVGVFIGMNARAAKLLQGLIQIIASIPATAVFPVIVLFIIRAGGGLDIGAIFLMLLGVQWYLLFNIIAGASAIPKDLIEISKAYGVRGFKKWKTLIMPCIFPYLITGLITAYGGAWNSTIVCEYVSFGGDIISTKGLGALISSSSAEGKFGILLLSTLTMSFLVVAINRLLWKRLFIIAKTKFILD
ncbi:MAG: ABC transporter permease subunit [Thermodesulfovibrio sp.]|nr:ABC transporter permease subunit [Thermodesulfovibrio sp.]MDW7998738.1 ABC transporter permease subunit [Thermodesulfovibrio sp.]